VGLFELIQANKDEIPRLRDISRSQISMASEKARRIMGESCRLGVSILGFNDPEFPRMLRDINDPPVLLFAKGNLHSLNTTGVAVIGTREPSPIGAKMAERSGYLFASNRLTVVSGLALGCDTAAHIGCLKAGGVTIAILAHGLDTIYPRKNQELALRIVDEGGCLLSEYPIGTRLHRSYLVDRDRLQSGISHGVFVVETAVKGGTMHTVGFALTQQRILGCFEHPEAYTMHEKAQGNKLLIEEGKALPIENDEQMHAFIAALHDYMQRVNSRDERLLSERKPPEGRQLTLFDDWEG
jgi:DNA processing protein